MKRNLIVFSIIIILVGSIIGGNYVYKLKYDIPNSNEIKSVKVHIGGNCQEENNTYYFNEKDNILEIIDINKQLLNYKDPNVDTWFLDVAITYTLKNGDEKNTVFKKIRPVDDYFEKIINSLEYKKQTINIFKIDLKDVNKIVFKDSYTDRKKIITIEDKDIIKGAYENSIKTYELYNRDENAFLIGNIEFQDIHDNIIANGMILREHEHWNDLFNEYEVVQPIKASPSEIKEIIIEKDDDEQIVIKDYDKIDQILNTYYNGYSSTKSSAYSVEIILKNPDMRHWYGSFFKGEVPDFVVESFK